MKKIASFRIALAAAALFAAGCAGNRASRRDAPAPEASAVKPAAAAPLDVARISYAEPDVREMAVRAIPELKSVRFVYDSDGLDAASRATLRANAAWLKAHPDVKVQIAGHCDQRGTVAYNLALGQRRSAAVRDYYVNSGVEASRMATISYGKERALCAKETEECWARDRRAETLEAGAPSVAHQ